MVGGVDSRVGSKIDSRVGGERGRGRWRDEHQGNLEFKMYIITIKATY